LKGQSAAFLEKSRELLDEADAILSINRHDAAARAAYMAGFHTAQALIFEPTGAHVHAATRYAAGDLIFQKSPLMRLAVSRPAQAETLYARSLFPPSLRSSRRFHIRMPRACGHSI
jgi:hypothetical protein